MRSEATPAAVILVHGLWTRGFVLFLQARRLRGCGFRPYLFSYPTVRLTLAENARRLAEFARRVEAPVVHLVGHSMGGLVILQMLRDSPLARPGRVVLLGTPCEPCLAAARLRRLPGGQLLLGRSLPAWDRACADAPFDRDIGVIAGNRSFGAARLLGGIGEPNDGVVTVRETRLPDMHDHLVLPVAHSEMLVSPAIARQVCAFLQHGSFERQAVGLPAAQSSG